MKNKKGMTLVEVVVAIGLFGIIMVTIFPAFLILNLMNNVSYENTDATYVAQDVMELVVNQNTRSNVNTVLVSEGYTQDSSTTLVDIFSREDGRYEITITLTKQSETSNLYNVLIVVDGVVGEAQGQRSQLETIVSFGQGLTP